MSTKSTAMECNRQLSNSPVPTPKTNHVSTVLLYDIPIVSLYIEGQERLCLAQISNTLLKQFSYNEIHNRRVALGITCVQCTPVQLEILRRAGAMPVSSRRCGMITRREAERLCKSFLGDNAPPRLPDDFAFSVHHKCAWGCRGSFLPSRYNSSRAKCIKCTYCGLFFSPNKFIFHSHRISANDKYIQPDAANFNSWRRHMMLSGHPHEEIVHAWEDVKAMFNGGTRKRLMASHSPLSTPAATSQKHLDDTRISGSSNEVGHGAIEESSRLSPKRSKDSGLEAVTAATVVGVTAVAAAVGSVTQQLPLRQFNMHPNVGQSNLCTTNMSGSEISIMPFSRSFMMDYMWHAHAVQSAAHIQQHQQHKCSSSNGVASAATFSIPSNCSIQPWIKASSASGSSSLLFGTVASGTKLTPVGSGQASELQTHSALRNSIESSESAILTSSNITGVKIFREPGAVLPQLFKSSAFKPVIQKHQPHQQQQDRTLNAVAAAVSTTTTLVSTSVYSSAATSLSSSRSSSSSSSSSSCSSTSSLTSNAQNPPTSVSSPNFLNRTKLCSTPNSLLRLLPPPVPPLLTVPIETLEVASSVVATATRVKQNVNFGRFSITSPIQNFIKESHSSEEDEEQDAEDDEMVDIETTEDDQQQQRPQTPHLKRTSQPLCIRKYEPGNSMDDIDVDGDSDIGIENMFDVVEQAPLEENARDVSYCSERLREESKVDLPADENKNQRIKHTTQLGRDSTTSNSSSIVEIVENSNTSEELLTDGLIKREMHTLYNMDKSTTITTTEKSNIGTDVDETAIISNCPLPSFKPIKISNELTSAIQVGTTTQRKQQTVGAAAATTITTTVAKSPATTGSVLMEALTHSNKSDVCIGNSNITINNNINPDLWHVARLSLQHHPTNLEACNISQQQHTVHQMRQQQQQQHHHQTLQLQQLYRQQLHATQLPQQQIPQSHHPVASTAVHDLLLSKHFHGNNFRYVGHETPTQANGVG